MASARCALGGVLLFISLCAFLAVIAATWVGPRVDAIGVDGGIPPALSGPENGPLVLDDFRLWLAIAVLLVLLAYVVPIWDMIANGALSPGSPPWGATRG